MPLHGYTEGNHTVTGELLAKLEVEVTDTGDKLTEVGGNLSTHTGDTANPHSVTKAQVGLTDVTDDAQLTRAANDFSSFTAKASPVSGDIILIEDSAAAGVKKSVDINNLPVPLRFEENVVRLTSTANSNTTPGNELVHLELLSITIPTTKDYIIEWWFLGNMSVTNGSLFADIDVTGATTTNLQTSEEEYQDGAAAQRMTRGGHYKFTLTAGSTTIQLRHQPLINGTSTLYAASLTIREFK